MPDLNCTVVSCVFNKTERCCKGDIKVEGAKARVTEETRCASFRPQKGDSFFNKAETPDKHICVNCEATDCVHNETCECKAEHIGIVGGHVYDSKETECATFQCRCG